MTPPELPLLELPLLELLLLALPLPVAHNTDQLLKSSSADMSTTQGTRTKKLPVRNHISGKRTRLSLSQKAEILSLIEKGVSQIEVMMKFKSGERTISRVKKIKPRTFDEGIASILPRKVERFLPVHRPVGIKWIGWF